MPQEHDAIALGEIHRMPNWTYADQAARLAATPPPADVGKVAWQLDNDTFWLLKDDSPLTWVQVGAAGAADQLSLNVVFDGGGAVLTTGIKLDVRLDFACTILGVSMLADQSGSLVVDIWKDTYANYPPVDADSITASAPPTITTAVKSEDDTLTGWTTSIAAGNTLRFNIDSVTTIQRCTLILHLQRS